MNLSHFEALFVFAALVSAVFAIINKDDPKEQLRYGFVTFGSFVAVAVVVGWLMFPFPW